MEWIRPVLIGVLTIVWFILAYLLWNSERDSKTCHKHKININGG
jgi:hypothetical protein